MERRKLMNFRAAEVERELWAAAAEEWGESVSEFLRKEATDGALRALPQDSPARLEYLREFPRRRHD